MSFESTLIFVSIAAYRDPQLVPTIEDCLRKASHPQWLRFGICWQRDDADPPFPFANDFRFRVREIHWRESKGACWARAQIMSLWQGEDWFLQIDSHCRFANGWDTTVLRIAAETGSPKPVVSTYPPSFSPGANEILSNDPQQMVFQQFTPEGIPQLRPGAFPRGSSSARPLRARFLAAGFLFAPGTFVEEVPYDPDLYFMGEEASMTVRAFTHGYDLFHPAESIVWHDYIRAQEPKHWDDHRDEAHVPTRWSNLDQASRRKVSRLLAGEPLDAFGLGVARTLKDYEAYAGLSFRHRKAQAYTLRGAEPPNPDAPADWPDKIYPWIATLRFTREQIPPGSLHNSQLWSLSILDSEGNEICHRDVQREELAALSAGHGELAVVCEFASETVPATWTLWPLTSTGQWLPKFGAQFKENDFAVLAEES